MTNIIKITLKGQIKLTEKNIKGFSIYVEADEK